MRDEEPIDAAINAAAAEMTAGEPGAVIRSRVAERIAARGLGVGSWWLVLGGAAAVLVLAVIVGRALSGSPGKPEGFAPRPEVRVAGSAPATPAAPSERPPAAPVGRALSGSPGEPDRVRPTSEPRLVDIDPIEIASLDAYAAAVDPMEAPMTITLDAIAIAPLEIP